MGAPVGQAWLLAAAGPRRLPAVPAPGIVWVGRSRLNAAGSRWSSPHALT